MLNVGKMVTSLGRIAAYLGIPVPPRQTVEAGVEVAAEAAKIQKSARRDLVDELQAVCDRVDEALTSLRSALKPVRRAAAESPEEFAAALAEFDADAQVRERFKPEGLCGEVDHLLVSTRSWLESLRWSWGVNEMNLLRQDLTQLQNLDSTLFQEYDNAVATLHTLGSRISQAGGKKERKAAVVEARAFLEVLDDPLRESAKGVRSVKNSVTRGKR